MEVSDGYGLKLCKRTLQGRKEIMKVDTRPHKLQAVVFPPDLKKRTFSEEV